MSKEIKENQLSVFLNNFEKLPAHVIKGMLNQANNEDEIFYITSLEPIITNQFYELSRHVRDMSTKASARQIADAEHFMKLSSGVILTNTVKSLSTKLSSPLSKIGLSGIIHEIKKIFLALVEIFKWTLPDWVLPLMTLIDEIIDDLMSMGVLKLSNIMSRKHVNYLAEMTEMKKLQIAYTSKNTKDEEED
jgi:hypothetical protein